MQTKFYFADEYAQLILTCNDISLTAIWWKLEMNSNNVCLCTWLHYTHHITLSHHISLTPYHTTLNYMHHITTVYTSHCKSYHWTPCTVLLHTKHHTISQCTPYYPHSPHHKISHSTHYTPSHIGHAHIQGYIYLSINKYIMIIPAVETLQLFS